MTTHELRNHLLALHAERAAASLAGLDHEGPYLHDLQAEIGAARAALVGAAVTEIASSAPSSGAARSAEDPP